MPKYISEKSFVERIYWLIRLRWVAVVSIILAVSFATGILKIPLVVFPLYAIACIIAFYNLAFFIFIAVQKNRESPGLFLLINKFTNLQITLDLYFLAVLIHYSGGIENPFIFYFVFHMIIASILLSRRASFLQATFAVALFFSIVMSEYYGVLPHYSLKRFISYDQHKNLIYILGVYFVFVSTLYIAVYMATSITKRLRGHEKELRKANELLNEKDRIKSEYVLRVTHDIKEHLAAIQGCIEPVSSGITGALNQKQKDLLSRAEQRTEKLVFFVKALLEITRIKLSKHIEMDYFSLPKTVASAISFVEARAKDKGIIINCQIAAEIDKIKGAQIYIEETIVNILVNSLKYSQENGKVEIVLKDQGNTVLIKITDNGIGIPKDEIPKICQEFYRASNAKAVEKTGTGLGLSIAKQVVERHNGRIWIESDVGKGCSVSIELPKE